MMHTEPALGTSSTGRQILNKTQMFITDTKKVPAQKEFTGAKNSY